MPGGEEEKGAGQAGAGGAGAKAQSKVTRDGGQRRSHAEISSKYALQKKFRAGKAGKRSWRIACGEAAGGFLVPDPLGSLLSDGNGV